MKSSTVASLSAKIKKINKLTFSFISFPLFVGAPILKIKEKAGEIIRKSYEAHGGSYARHAKNESHCL